MESRLWIGDICHTGVEKARSRPELPDAVPSHDPGVGAVDAWRIKGSAGSGTLPAAKSTPFGGLDPGPRGE
jgi:hypothetical protein